MRRILLILASLFLLFCQKPIFLRKHTEDLNLCEIKMSFYGILHSNELKKHDWTS